MDSNKVGGTDDALMLTTGGSRVHYSTVSHPLMHVNIIIRKALIKRIHRLRIFDTPL